MKKIIENIKNIDWKKHGHALTNNLGLKVIALIFSALLWLFVVNIDDPINSRVFNDIPYVVRNEEIATNDGKMFKIMDDIDSVRVVVHARRSVLNKIKSKDITAVIDLRERDPVTNIVPIKAVVNGYEENLEVTTECTPNNVMVKVEGSTTKSFPISVSTENKQRDGYELGEMTTNPERIQITGAKSTIEDIQRVVAQIDVMGISEDCVKEAKLIIFDGNGNVMDQSAMQNNLGDKGVSVNVQVLPIKKVKLNFNVSGTPAEGYRLTGLNSEPASVEVYGTKEDLSNLTALDIPDSEINIDNLQSRKEYTVDISKYLPEGIELTEETAKNVLVTVIVEEEGTRTIFLSTGAVRLDNLQEGLSAVVETPGDLEIRFAGEEALLEKLNIQNAASVDLKEYTEPGTYDVPVEIELNQAITLMDTPMITITISEKKEETGKTKE